MDNHESNQRLPISAERIFGLLLVILSLLCIFDLRRNPHLEFWGESGPCPSFLPYVMSISLIILAFFLIIRPSHTSTSQLGASISGTIKYILLVLALAWAFPILGGIISIFLFVVFVMLWVENNKWALSIMVGLISTTLLWGIFVKLLRVNIPLGLFGV